MDFSRAAKALDPPKGWSNDPGDIADFYWPDENDNLKITLETCYGLPDARPLCSRLPDTGDIMFLFQFGSEYLVWNVVATVLCRIEEPQKLEDIYAVISKSSGRLGGLKMVDVLA